MKPFHGYFVVKQTAFSDAFLRSGVKFEHVHRLHLGYLSTHQREIYAGTGRMDKASHAMDPDIKKMIKSI
ncbi:MAG TPA: hypothetical protein VLM78_00185, partial [Anaerolineales bacterium]|nr:hypothetical protein [Anaerolineales bacterium]